MTNTLPNRLYPGMGCSATEFFVAENGVKIIKDSKVLPFCEISFETQKILQDAIDADLEVKLHLFDMHPTSKVKRLEQFVTCRFGGLDFQGDIQDGQLQDGEFWACPKRGKCASEGILCKLPIYNGQRLTNEEVHLMQECSTSKKNEVIAEDLSLAKGSFHKSKKIMYGKLGIQTKQECTFKSMLLNLI